MDFYSLSCRNRSTESQAEKGQVKVSAVAKTFSNCTLFLVGAAL